MDLPKHVVVVGALVRNAVGDVLMIRHPKRGWEIPQGKVEEGEDLLEALQREVLEESGIDIDPGPLAAVYSKISSPTAVIFNFLARYRGGEPRTCEESLEVGWFQERDVLGKISNTVIQERVRTLLAFSGTVIYRSYASPPYSVKRESALTGV